jgi:3-deoxy-D-manno-octulosonic-acid transferase
MFIVYDLIFIIFAIFYLPVFIFKKKFHRGFLMRLGFLPSDLIVRFKEKRCIWLHAVSVGEVMASAKLINALRENFSDRPLVITTVTSTGNRIAKSFAKKETYVLYLPLDLRFIVNKFISKINPSIFISAETEIWPNLILTLAKKNIPIALVNGRISDRSYKGYLKIRPLLKAILEKIALFAMQTPKDAERIITLGAPRERVYVTGNMKFDVTDYTDKKITDYTDKLGLKKEERLFIAGSTHPGEEKIILEIFKKLLSDFSNLRLVIAPRHIDRTAEIERLVSNRGFIPQRVSKIDPILNTKHLTPIFILDTMGQLSSLYSVATIVFVGGSLVKKGGHNIIEPAYFGKSILFGRWMFNFQDIANLFLSRDAAIMVRTEEELLNKIKFLLNNPAKIIELGEKAKQLVFESQGATQKNLESILKLGTHPIFVAN